jgi:hypothetical protein
MMKRVWKTYDLHPDGVQIEVNWDSMVIGSSIFVPCINTEEAVKQVQAIFAERSWQYESRVRIEDDRLGVRIWRTV